MPLYWRQSHTQLERSIEVENPHTTDLFKASLYPQPYLKLNILIKISQPLLHKPHPCTHNTPPPPKKSSPNFRATTLLQSIVSSTPNCHNHFPSKALLKVVNFLTPNPPFSRGAHTLTHPTKCVLESHHITNIIVF